MGSLLLRSLHIAGRALLSVAHYIGLRLIMSDPDQDKIEALRGRKLADLLESLGATFIKFGQIMSTRPDILPLGIVDGLRRLQDQVPPEAFEDIDAVVRAELGETARELEITPEPIAAASVAQVHRATDGTRSYAMKIQRPGVRQRVARDLALLRMGARVIDLLPSMQMLSLPGAVKRFADAMRAQLDFSLEAANNARFAENFAAFDGVRVPEVFAAYSSDRVLTMELIDGVRATEPERVGGDRAAIAHRGLNAILQMVFKDGFVHADMHPGNVFIEEDGTIVFIDLGLVAEIDEEMLRPWVATFKALYDRDGKRAAELFYGFAPFVGTPNYAAYERDVLAHFDSFLGKPIGELEASIVIGEMMNVLRRHYVQIDPVFTVVNIAMLVAEGLGKQLDPALDMVEIAGPHLLEAMVTAPPGKPPYRQAPS